MSNLNMNKPLMRYPTGMPLAKMGHGWAIRDGWNDVMMGRPFNRALSIVDNEAIVSTYEVGRLYAAQAKATHGQNYARIWTEDHLPAFYTAIRDANDDVVPARVVLQMPDHRQ